jgi:phenylpropionate dioxygenase-like ring-hydroxylating dioxygenase large terminal subunit
MAFQRNSWYMAGWAEELSQGQLFSRTILDEPIVFYRKQSGEPAALYDRCPHRFAPLSAGRLIGDEIQCGYHGLKFDCRGACVSNPHGPVPKAASVASYPVEERYGILWIWMGESAKADAARIPDLSQPYAAPQSSQSRGYLPTKCHYQLIVDNVADLSHTDFLHPVSLGGVFSKTKAQVEERDDTVRITWLSENSAALPVYDMFMPTPGQPVDLSTEVRWHAPGVMPLNICCTPTGRPQEEGIGTHNVHIVTPETEGTSHYWFWLTRNYRPDDAAMTNKRQEIMFGVFTNEDKPMLEAQQRRLGSMELMELEPVQLVTDAGSMRIRRILNRLIHQEQAEARTSS